MSTTTQQNYKPVAYARPNWREREALKEKQQREAAQKYAEDMQRKQYENTEQNFPTTMTAAKRKAMDAPQGFSNLAKKWRQDDELEQKLEAYRKSKTEMERRALLNSIYVLRSRRARHICKLCSVKGLPGHRWYRHMCGASGRSCVGRSVSTGKSTSLALNHALFVS
jgi:hypothetical protein